MSKKIILLGYMGCGKSTIGAHIATSLSLPFQDLDVFIAEQEGKSIPEIFQEKGEIYFRRQEQEHLKRLLALPYPMVVALGGGTPCYGKAMELVREATPYRFYLQLPAKELVARLSLQQEQRPLIRGIAKENLEEFVNIHLFERAAFYTQAAFVIPCLGLSVEEIGEKIRQKIK